MAAKNNNNKAKSLETWIWDAACSIRGAADALKFKEFILPLIFVKRLCDVFDDEMERFPAGSPGGKIDWGWVQHMYSSLNPSSGDDTARAAIVLDTGAASWGSGNQGSNKEKDCRNWFLDNDLI